MDAAVDVGIAAGVVIRDCVDDDLRLLACCGAVQVDQRVAIYLNIQNREFLTYCVYVESMWARHRCDGYSFSGPGDTWEWILASKIGKLEVV